MINDNQRPGLPMNGHPPTVAANSRRLLLQFLEMQIPMAFGALVCYLVVSRIASTSLATVYHPGTYLFLAGDVVFLTVPVVAWVVRRGLDWRRGVGMAGSMVAPVALIVGVGQLAGAAYLEWLLTAGYPAMSLGILVYLLCRPHQPRGLIEAAVG